MGIFVNHTNHTADKWSEEQRLAAERYGQIKDVLFPSISASWSSQQVRALAKQQAAEIIRLKPEAVLCQGEFTYVHCMIGFLQAAGMKVLAACSERLCKERHMPDGHTERVSVFAFVQFREYF